jgi:cob(I)alamin adenosyltransferase
MGLTHVYTGDGKGKTTASYGLLLRALGSGMSVYLGQFFKNADQSELRLLNELKKHLDKNQILTITQFETYSKDTVIACLKGFEEIKKALFSGLYDMVIADEINVVINLGIIEEEEILEVIEENKEVEFILTGRCAKESIVKKANLVSDIKKVKHYHDEGVIPRIGIEK